MSAFRMGTYTVAVAALALMMFFVADEVSAAVEISPGGTSTLSDGVNDKMLIYFALPKENDPKDKTSFYITDSAENYTFTY